MWKKWNHLKNTVFTMVIAHTATGFRQYFHPWIIKNMDLETVSHFGTLNQRKITKMSPKMHSKIDKNWYLDPKVPVGCPCGPLDHQNGHSGYPKWSLKVSKMLVLGIKGNPFQQSTSQQLTADKGPAAGGEALGYIYSPPPFRVQGVRKF